MSHWEEALGQIQDTLEGLYLSAGLGMPLCSLEDLGGCDWGEGCLGILGC